MKVYIKIFVFIFFLFLFKITYGGLKTGYEIKFKIPNLNNTTAKIGYFEGSKFNLVDSTIINHNIALFSGTSDLFQGLYIIQFGSSTVDFIVSEQNFYIELNSASNNEAITVQNSISNTILFNYKKTVKQKKELVGALKRRHLTDQDTRKEIKQIEKSINKYRDSIFKKYPDNLACKIIRAGIEIKPSTFLKQGNLDSITILRLLREHALDNIDMSDERLIRTPYLEMAIRKSLNLTQIVPDSLANTCDFIIGKSRANNYMYQYTLNFFKDYFEKSNRPWMDVLYTYIAKKYYLSGNSNLPDTNELFSIKASIKRMDPILTGKIAPPIDFIDTLGKITPLYSVNANYTILYFWDADCNHCQEITPKLWEYYKRIKKSGIEVYAVTIQQNPLSWKEYLRKYRLTWINVFHPFKIEEIYKKYQVGTTPSIFLLDKDKRIICKNISLEELNSYLKMLNIL